MFGLFSRIIRVVMSAAVMAVTAAFCAAGAASDPAARMLIRGQFAGGGAGVGEGGGGVRRCIQRPMPFAIMSTVTSSFSCTGSGGGGGGGELGGSGGEGGAASPAPAGGRALRGGRGKRGGVEGAASPPQQDAQRKYVYINVKRTNNLKLATRNKTICVGFAFPGFVGQYFGNRFVSS